MYNGTVLVLYYSCGSTLLFWFIQILSVNLYTQVWVFTVFFPPLLKNIWPEWTGGCFCEHGRQKTTKMPSSFNANWDASPQSTKQTCSHNMNTSVSQTRTHCGERSRRCQTTVNRCQQQEVASVVSHAERSQNNSLYQSGLSIKSFVSLAILRHWIIPANKLFTKLQSTMLWHLTLTYSPAKKSQHTWNFVQVRWTWSWANTISHCQMWSQNP